ncbi:Putative F-box protein [Arachis hypogaea]|nr:Putative F-box protein [Arachis hypogaea]
MEQNNNSGKSINDMLPPELITQILLRLSVKHLGRVKSVSKFWNNLISDPNFVKSHFELSLAPTHRCIFIPEVTIDHRSIDLDALSHATYADAAAATITKIPPYPDYDDYIVLGSCRGFIALYQYPHFFVIWNPLTGSHRIISCHHIAKIDDMATNGYYCLSGELLFGFGKRKGFLEIPVPEQVGRYYPCHLTALGGFFWTSYEIPSSYFEPVWLSEDGDFIGFDESDGISKYNVRGELLLRLDRPCDQIGYVLCTVYTESLLILPNDGPEEKEGSSVKGTEESTNLAT